jgi:hypothetical protein
LRQVGFAVEYGTGVKKHVNEGGVAICRRAGEERDVSDRGLYAFDIEGILDDNVFLSLCHPDGVKR